MAIRLPVATTSGHVSRAILFYNMKNLYFSLGKTTPWEGELEAEKEGKPFSAPAPSVETTEITELIGLKRIEYKSLVVPDDEGTLVYREKSWRKVSVEEAIQHKARWVYIEASIYYDEFKATAYRQIGVHSMVPLQDEVPENTSVLLPNQIKNQGILEILDQRKVVNRNEDSKDTFSMIIEF